MTDLWDVIVGIDLDLWIRADTGEQIHWLAWLRDHPVPQQGPRPLTTCANCIEVANYSSRRVASIPGPGCKHA